MINPQLLQHLSRVDDEDQEDEEDSGFLYQVKKQPSKSKQWRLLTSINSTLWIFLVLFAGIWIGWMTGYYTSRCQAGESFQLLSLPRIVRHFLVALTAGVLVFTTVVPPARKTYQTFSRNRIQRQRTASILQLSQLLGAMGAPMLADEILLEYNHAPLHKPSVIALIQLLTKQRDLMECCQEAIQILQQCSRWVGRQKRGGVLPLASLLRTPLYAVMTTNRRQLQNCCSVLLETTHVTSTDEVPSSKNLRKIRQETLELLSILCERSVVQDVPKDEQARRLLLAVSETQKRCVYLKALLASCAVAKEDPEEKTTAIDSILEVSKELQLALTLLREDYPTCCEDSSMVWRKTLGLSQDIASRLETILVESEEKPESPKDTQSPTTNNAELCTITETHGDPALSLSHVIDCLTENTTQPSHNSNHTLVYSTTVAPRPMRRRKPPAPTGSSPASPFDFVDELQLRLQSLPSPTELNVNKE